MLWMPKNVNNTFKHRQDIERMELIILLYAGQVLLHFRRDTDILECLKMGAQHRVGSENLLSQRLFRGMGMFNLKKK